MKIKVVTLFPDLINSFLDNGIFKKAFEKELVKVEVINLRDYSSSKHRSVDDTPYGGKPGMVIAADSFMNFFENNSSGFVVFPSPQGVKLNNNLSRELSTKDEITIICGHYEGIDERVIERYVDLELSIGDYVLSGGELPSLVILDSIVRFIPGFIAKDSVDRDSFENSLLNSAVYTKPSSIDFDKDGLDKKGLDKSREDISSSSEVPKELLSGNHSLVEAYRRRDAIYRTLVKRPDLLLNIDKKDIDEVILLCESIVGFLKKRREKE